MKKRFAALIAMLLCAVLLAGCAGAWIYAGLPEAEGERRTIPFPQMEYTRPDIDRLTEAFHAAAREIEAGCRQSRAEELMDACDEEYEAFATAYKLAMIRSDRDTRDEYYREEVSWCAENESAAEQALTELYHVCVGTEYAGELGFGADDLDLYGEGGMSDETVELMQRESGLIAQYREMTENAVIELDGEKVDYNSYMMTAEGEETDRALTEYYRQNNERAAEIYIELVNLRNDIALSRGYDSYEAMMYGPEGYDRDYSPQDAEKLMEDIRRYIAPMLRDDSGAIGYLGEGFREMDSERLLNAFEPAVRSLGGEIGEAFDFMREYGLYDVECREAKADLGYTTYLDAYDAPYLFLKTDGAASDLMELAHEFGHFTDGYINGDAYETLDLAEFFSQGMEYLMIGRLGDGMPESERAAVYNNKVMDTLLLYTGQAAYAEFEHRVYQAEEDELTAEYLNALSLSLAKEFGYYSEETEELLSLEWMGVPQFFIQPFYVISYPVSNDVAMQVFEMELEESGKGLEKYIEMLYGGTAYIMEAVEQAGLESPFTEGHMERTAQTVWELLAW